MRYTAIALIVLTILLHPKEKELLVVLKTADKICTTYDIEADTVLPNDRAFANKGQLKKVADVLSENAFTFNSSNDTIILRFQCADYLVGKYRTIIGLIKYYPLPLVITIQKINNISFIDYDIVDYSNTITICAHNVV